MKLKPKSKRLLLLLARKMRGLKNYKGHFDMSHFYEHRGRHKAMRDGEKLKVKNLRDCGTSACAFGWAASFPEIQRATGLHAVYDGYGDVTFYVGKEHSWDSFSMAQKAFGIPPHVAVGLFGAKSHIKTPQEWADHCEAYIAALR